MTAFKPVDRASATPLYGHSVRASATSAGWTRIAVGAALLAALFVAWKLLTKPAEVAAPPPPTLTVATPLQREVIPPSPP